MTDPGATRDDRARWQARYAASAGPPRPPSAWAIDRCLSLPPDDVILDLAGGSGRHAIPLARAGRTVIVVDFIERAVAAAVARQPGVLGIVADTDALPIARASLDAILCVSFLDRGLFRALAAMLRPGGTLVYETFTLAHLPLVTSGRAHGPTSPSYLLEPGELPRLVQPLVVREATEGLVADDAGERHVARVVATKLPGSGIADLRTGR